MRRVLSIALLAAVTWVLAAPLFAPSLESTLPACCRRNGKHRCCCEMAERLRNSDGFAAVREKCPCHPAGLAVSHSGNFTIRNAEEFRIALRVFEARTAQRLACYRPASHRTSPKRGPPISLA